MDKVKRLYWKAYKKQHKLSWHELTKIVNETEGTSYKNVRSLLRSDRLDDSKTNGPRLVFSDTHIPYHREGYIEFLKRVHKQFNCHEEIICLGDLADHHAISRHDKEPDAMGDINEFEQAYTEIQKLTTVFPKGIVTLGNHDRIPERQAATLGISQRYLKSFDQLWGLPNGWKVVDEIIINDVLYSHGLNGAGKDGAINKAISEQMSIAQGHYHAFGGCKYIANKRNLIFGLNTGCLCDPNSIAMAYGKHAKFRPTLGCGVVFNSSYAIFVPWVLE